MTKKEAQKVRDGLVGWDNPQIISIMSMIDGQESYEVVATDAGSHIEKRYDPETGFFN